MATASESGGVWDGIGSVATASTTLTGLGVGESVFLVRWVTGKCGVRDSIPLVARVDGAAAVDWE